MPESGQETEVIHENSYRTDPEPHNVVSCVPIQKEVRTILEDQFKEYQYEATAAADRCQDCASLIMHRIKPLLPPRYKCACEIYIAQSERENKYGLNISSRCLWNSDSDNFISESYVGQGITVSCHVFMTYKE